MEKGMCRNDAEPPSQPGQGSRLESKGTIHSRNERSQRRKKRNSACRLREPQCVGNQESEQSSKRRLKTSNDPGVSRRQRNLKNIMMVNRLEINIARMEAHFQNLGFDLGNQAKAQAVPQPSAPENLHPPLSPGVSESENVLEEGLWCGESIPKNIHGNSEEPHANTFSDIEYQGCDASDLHEVEEGPFPDESGGLLIPRCMLDTKNARALPILLHEGVEWMGRKSGVTPRLSSGKHRNATSFGVLDEDFPRKVFCPLPSKEEALSLLHEYLQNFNSLCPLFQQAKLISLFNQDRLDVAFHKPPFWACANVVFALGIAFRIKNGNVAQSEHQRSWLFIKNAFGSFHDLCLGQPDLWSIQALLGMSLFFLGTMSAEPCCFLATAAIRMSHQIGLGKREQDVTLAPEDLEQRRNIFWIAYCLDREISLRFGKPPTQSDDDMSIGLPTELPTDSQLYKDLYSAAAKDRPLSEIIASVKTFDEMLQSWREDLPLDYQPESQRLPNFQQSSLSLRTWCLSTPLPYAPALFASESLCANAAQASIKLMKYMPQGHISLVGILIHYPIVALATLSSTVIRNPLNALQLTDMMLIDQVDTFLSSLVVSIPNQAIGRLRVYCATYRAGQIYIPKPQVTSYHLDDAGDIKGPQYGGSSLEVDWQASYATVLHGILHCGFCSGLNLPNLDREMQSSGKQRTTWTV